MSDSSVKRLLVCLLLMATGGAYAQPGPTATPVVDMGVITAKQASGGLGFGISQPGYTQDWEFAAAKAAGASWVRIQCPWSAVGQQTPPPNNLPAAVPFVQTAPCAAALTSAAKHGLSVTEIAAFGPPAHQILYATIPNGAPVGATSLNLQVFQGLGGSTVNSITPVNDYWCPVTVGDNGQASTPYQCAYIPTYHNSYQGALITQVNVIDSTHATIGLASALSAALPANPVAATGCSIAVGSGTLTCTSGNFNPNFVNKVQLVIPGAASFGGNFVTTIDGYISPTQVLVPCCANTAVQNVTVQMNFLYAIGEIEYPSTATSSPTDPSVVAYGNYVSFLAADMASRGVSGEIEIWNEPPWSGDPWDFRPLLFDNVTTGAYVASNTYKAGNVVNENAISYTSLVSNNLGHDPASSPAFWTTNVAANVYQGQPGFGANFGFAANIQQRTFPAGVTAVWNGTSGNGYASLLSSNMLQYSGQTLNQPSNVITRESFHPYGGAEGNPEDMMGIPSCLEQAAAIPTVNPFSCYLPNQSDTANMMYAVFLDDRAKLANPAGGIGHSITETNIVGEAPNQRTLQARFDLRQFLGYEAMGVTPIEFFQLWDDTHNDPSFSFVDYNAPTMTPFQSMTAMTGLMTDLSGISNPPVGPYTESALASVQSYTGTFPIVSMHVVGSRPAATANSDAMMVWQLSASPTDWLAMPSPAPAPVTINIPRGTQVTQVVNLTTRASVSYTLSGQTINLNVADDPVEILLDPAPASTIVPTMTLVANPSSTAYGGQVVLSATLTPYATAQHSSNGESITYLDGSTPVGTGTLSSGVASINVTSLPVGVSSLSASFAGDSALAAATATTTFTVTGVSPGLALSTIANVPYGTTTVQASATSASSGAITYSVVSGPATISGTAITLTGIGPVTIQASQAAYGNYTAASATTTFTVSAVSPGLALASIAGIPYRTTTIPASATTSSSGVITYSVVSGPAAISGTAITLTGIGAVTIQASQAASGNYTAATATTSFNVTATSPGLALASIANVPYGTVNIQTSATSASQGAITYSVVGGPATISGTTITLTGTGVVTIQASQAAYGNYTSANATTTFTALSPGANLTISTSSMRVYSPAPFVVTSTSLSSGAISYKVLSGPATVSGNLVTMTGVGLITLSASQQALGGYSAASASATINVVAALPALGIGAIPGKTFGSAPFAVSATSPSPGAITFSVLSGPATISGTTVTLTGVGTVTVQANQSASGPYLAGKAQTSFAVH